MVPTCAGMGDLKECEEEIPRSSRRRGPRKPRSDALDSRLRGNDGSKSAEV